MSDYAALVTRALCQMLTQVNSADLTASDWQHLTEKMEQLTTQMQAITLLKVVEVCDDDRPAIECPFCHRVSYNPRDIRENYCEACHRFREDILPGARGSA
jgi:hypothetical protein